MRTEIALSDETTVSVPLIRQTVSPWRGPPVSFTFGGKPVLDRDCKPCFAEIASMRDLRARGWNAVWTQAFGGGMRYFEAMPAGWSAKSDTTIPAKLDALLRAIQKVGNTKACFDVIAWRGDEVLICEAKRRGKDRLTKAQLRFIAGALSCGITTDSFLIVEWAYQSSHA